MLVKFWGVHGSLPRPGSSTVKFGGNTPCVEVRYGNYLIIFDAGSGIRELGEELLRCCDRAQQNETNITGHIFLSHLHWDHIQGFPFFAPAFIRGNEFHLYGGCGSDFTIHKALKAQMSQPSFPVALSDMGASLFFRDLQGGEKFSLGDGVVQAQRVNHPGGCFAYRLEQSRKVVVYASDTEIEGEIDPVLVQLARDADVLIHDGMFTPEQYHGIGQSFSRRSWGHSTWEGATRTANAARVGRLVLFHHGNDDATVEQIEQQARTQFPETIAAYEGLKIEL